MKIVGDYSYYNELTPAQWDVQAKVLDGVIIRLGFGLSIDNMANAHIEQAKRLGIPYVGYWWADPTRQIPDILQVISRAVDIFQPAGLYLDAEQYWRDWGAYMRQDLVAAYATRFTPSQLNIFYSNFYNQTKSALKIPVGNYSADWFVNKYAPDMAKWIYTSPHYWEARYARYYNQSYWSTVTKRFPLEISEIPKIADMLPIVRGGARQFESYVEIKGLSLWHGWHQDWNRFTDESFYTMFGQPGTQPPTPPEPEPDPDPVGIFHKVVRTGTYNLNVRATPALNGKWLTSLVPETIVKVYDRTTNELWNGKPWALISPPDHFPQEWVASYYLDKI